MSIEQQPKVRLQQKQVVEQARQSALKDVQTRLKNLSLQVAALRDPGTWNDVQTVDSTDTTKVVATRTGGAAAGGYSLQIVGARTRGAAHAGQRRRRLAVARRGDDTLHISVGTTTPVSIDVSIAAGDSLQTIADKINGTSGTPVYASLMNGKLVLSGKQTGADNTIAVTAARAARSRPTSASPRRRRRERGLLGRRDPLHRPRLERRHRRDAPASTLTLRGTTGTGTVSVVVGSPAADTDAIQAKVQAFVDQYNSTIDFIRVEAQRGRGSSTRPTDADRAKGVLRGDPGLTSLLSSLRARVADVFSGPRRPTPTSSPRRASRPAPRPARARSARTRSRAS